MVIGESSRLGQAIKSLSNLKVNPSVMLVLGEVVFID